MGRNQMIYWAIRSLLLTLLGALGFVGLTWAQESAAAVTKTVVTPITEAIDSNVGQVQKNLNIIWVILSAALVFWMGAGFAMVEGGFTRAKNAGNIMAKNLMTISVTAIAYWAIGFAFMFGISNGIMVGASHFFLEGFDNTSPEGHWTYAFWMFHVLLAGVAATIVSGAVAERVKFSGYLIYTFIIALFIYPIFGHWAWGALLNTDNAGSWLSNLGFIDFAGSTVVHSVGAGQL